MIQQILNRRQRRRLLSRISASWQLVSTLISPAKINAVFKLRSTAVLGDGLDSGALWKLEFGHRGGNQAFDVLQRRLLLPGRKRREKAHVSPALQDTGADQIARQPPHALAVIGGQLIV